jgi:hypothetical protein
MGLPVACGVPGLETSAGEVTETRRAPMCRPRGKSWQANEQVAHDAVSTIAAAVTSMWRRCVPAAPPAICA